MPANIVRVDLARLDELMQTLGELVISRARLEDRLKQLQETVSEKDLRPLKETNQQMERQLRELRAGMLRVRLVPISDVFTRMQFVVRDLARSTGKRVKVELIGQDTEIDKFVVERLMDPLLHLVRNAVSHGLETLPEREAKGKPLEGKVVLRAATVGEMAVVEVEDDGKGIDAAEIIAKGKQMGILSPEALGDGRKGAPLDFDPRGMLSGTLLLDILCTSGFSTRTEADLTSGRGVGLAVVHRSVQELGGSMTLDSQVGVKTKFRIQLPLTLAIADALLATAGGQTFAIPLSAVREIIEVQPQDVTVIAPSITAAGRWNVASAKHPASAPRVKPRDSAELKATSPEAIRAEIIYHRGTVLPLLRLASFFNLSSPTKYSQHAFIIGFGDETNNLGIVVDRVIGQREIVVRPLTDALVNVPGISGATDLGDGRVVLILDASELIRFRVDAL
uniref:Chemotaxis protein CheA n=1 Tax=Planktothricoides sp. SpSt-374 TaxID=2282167 RepID=A0A7C3VK71_9CYAN